MRVLIGYESMYGKTRRVADAIAAGFAETDTVSVAPVSSFDDAAFDVELLIIGVPTHAHGLPRPASRRAAIDSAHTKYETHPLDPSAGGTGVREWLEELPPRVSVLVATYDTRFRPPGWLTGHPARAVSRALRRRGATVVAPPASFFVGTNEHLRPGEIDRARSWGARVRDAATAQLDRRADASAG